MEDDAEGDLALFLTDEQVEIPIEVEFFDRAGNLISRRTELEAMAARGALLSEQLRPHSDQP